MIDSLEFALTRTYQLSELRRVRRPVSSITAGLVHNCMPMGIVGLYIVSYS